MMTSPTPGDRIVNSTDWHTGLCDGKIIFIREGFGEVAYIQQGNAYIFRLKQRKEDDEE